MWKMLHSKLQSFDASIFEVGQKAVRWYLGEAIIPCCYIFLPVVFFICLLLYHAVICFACCIFYLFTDSTDCAYNAMPPDNQILLLTAYIMAGICVLCLLVPMVFLYVHWQMEKCRGKPEAPEDNGLLGQTESDSRE